MTLPEMLRARRAEMGLSQRDLAERANHAEGIYQSRISDWEAGKGRPSLRQLHLLIAALEVDQDRWVQVWLKAELDEAA